MPTVPLVVNDGLEYAVDAINTALDADVASIGAGTGSTAAAAGDSALGTEVETRGGATISQPTATTVRAVATVNITATRALREVGLFNAASGGTLCVRAVYDVISLESGDTITYTIDQVLTDNS